MLLDHVTICICTLILPQQKVYPTNKTLPNDQTVYPFLASANLKKGQSCAHARKATVIMQTVVIMDL